MPIEKAAYLKSGRPDEEDQLDIEVVDALDTSDPSLTPTEDGGLIVDLSGAGPVADTSGVDHDANLADHIEELELATLGSDLCNDIEEDLRSRSKWEQTLKDGLKLLGLQMEKRSEPWDGACGVIHPLLAEAVVRFQSELVTETFPAHGPVKTKILGSATAEKEQAAARVKEDMNKELTDRMTEYRNEHERLLWNLPIMGSAFKKVYYDPALGRQASMFVGAEDFIVSYGASDLATAVRYTQRMKKTPNDLKKLMVSGFYKDIDFGDPTKSNETLTEEKDKLSGVTTVTEIEHHTLYECNVDLKLPGFEDPLDIALPYVVTIEKESQKVLSIRRNWKKDDEARKKRQYFVHYQYIPGFGFYGFGLIHLVGGFAESATSLLRQLVDAGTLANLPGGLKTRGLRIKGDDTPIGPGEWRDVDVPSGNLKENLMQLPYQEPSAVLASLLDKIVEEGRKFAAVAEMKVADFDSNSPVGTTMALLERTLKVMTAVQARIYEAMKIEFRIIKDLIRDHGTDSYEYEPETGTADMKGADFDSVDILPVADPNAATMSQRIVQWQAVMQLATTAPQIYDLPELHGQMLDILGVKNVDKLIPTRKQTMQPMDPVSENMAIMNGKPVKAFITQDHDSHIAVHQMAMQDPKMMQMIGQNPMAAQIQAAAMAHLMEHMAFQYRAAMEQMMGVPLPPPDQPMDPEAEVRLSSLLAQAAPKLLGKNQNEAAAAAAQAAAQDPVLQQQQRETEVKQAEVDRKVAKDAEDVRLKEEELRLRAQEIEINAAAKGAQLGQQAVIHKDKTELERDKLASGEKQTGFKAAIDLTKQDRDREEKAAERDLKHNQTAASSADKEKDRQHKSEESDKQREHDSTTKAADRIHQASESDKATAAKAKADKPAKKE